MSHFEDRQETAALLRQLAAAFADPDRDTVTETPARRAAWKLARAAALLFRDGTAALERSSGWKDGYSAGTVGGGSHGGDTPDPTHQRANTRLGQATRPGRRLPAVSTWHAHLRSTIHRLEGDSDHALMWLSRILSTVDPDEEQRPVATCASETCGQAVTKAGYCNDCYMWRYRNPGPNGELMPVPAAVIAERTKKKRWRTEAQASTG